MKDETKPESKICSTCKHYRITAENVKQGTCRLLPPDSFPIGPVQGVVTVMMVPRQVPYDWGCAQHALPE